MLHATLRLSSKHNSKSTLDLKYWLFQTPFKDKWVDRVLEANQRNYPISEPWAFYNLNDEWSEEDIVNTLNSLIDTCNDYKPGMFEHKLDRIDNQDRLNYIHSIFEREHGKLDEWKLNPILQEYPVLRDTLSGINQTVHRCETFGGPKYIRVVNFDLPKTETFTSEDYKLFTTSLKFGGLYTLYADVGKPLEDLAKDNDQHHIDFVPTRHYSSDCVAYFSDEKVDIVDSRRYLEDNWSYFEGLGYTDKDHDDFTVGAIQIGQLQYTNRDKILEQVSKYNNIQNLFVY